MRTANRLDPDSKFAGGTDNDDRQAYLDGFATYTWYKTIDNVGDLFPSTAIGVNEQNVNCPCGQYGAHTRWDEMANNWTVQYRGGTVSPRSWPHEMKRWGAWNPDPVGPDDPGTDTQVFHLGQRWRVGSTAVGVGVQVQTNRQQFSRGYGDHLNICTP